MHDDPQSGDPQLDLSQFQRPNVTLSQPLTRPKGVRPDRCSGEFLRGPIPLRWLSKACQHDGKTVNTALAIWFEAGRRGNFAVNLTTALLARFHVGRKAKYAALSALHEAGLIKTCIRRGKNPLVTIVN
jgi:hypothetical protein